MAICEALNMPIGYLAVIRVSSMKSILGRVEHVYILCQMSLEIRFRGTRWHIGVVLLGGFTLVRPVLWREPMQGAGAGLGTAKAPRSTLNVARDAREAMDYWRIQGDVNQSSCSAPPQKCR